MAIEQASMHPVRKPWGSTDLLPWSDIPNGAGAIGELWCQRPGASSPEPALLLKLLFTSQPLSIQVHPSDAFARSIGLDHGKTEAWYILSATADARVALGLSRELDAHQLRTAIEDGSIADLVQWRSVHSGDVIFVPAGTIHAIGPGLVLAEIQQRSDVTFRLFDYGRNRELHVDDAVGASDRSPPQPQRETERLSGARTLLNANPHFVLERIDLSPDSQWQLNAEHETWLLVVAGNGTMGASPANPGKAFYLDAASARIQAGSAGMTALVAYLGPDPAADLLSDLDHLDTGRAQEHPISPPPLRLVSLNGTEARA